MLCANALSNEITSAAWFSWLLFTFEREWNTQWSARSTFISPNVQLHAKCGKQPFSFSFSASSSLFSFSSTQQCLRHIAVCQVFRIPFRFPSFGDIIIYTHIYSTTSSLPLFLPLLKYAYWIRAGVFFLPNSFRSHRDRHESICNSIHYVSVPKISWICMHSVTNTVHSWMFHSINSAWWFLRNTSTVAYVYHCMFVRLSLLRGLWIDWMIVWFIQQQQR